MSVSDAPSLEFPRRASTISDTWLDILHPGDSRIRLEEEHLSHTEVIGIDVIPNR